jgi:hypothetical protein
MLIGDAIMKTKGYKFIVWDDVLDDNAEFYLSKIRSNQEIHYTELKYAKGIYDREEISGIYFCKTLEELCEWLKLIFADNSVVAIEILEIETNKEVIEKKYDYYKENMVAYITESCNARLLKDNEIPDYMNKIFTEYFG